MRTTTRLSGAVVAVVAGACFLLAVSGCCSTPGLLSPSAAYVAADSATREVVAPKLLEYLEADPHLALDEVALANWRGLLEDWRLRNEAAAAQVSGGSK